MPVVDVVRTEKALYRPPPDPVVVDVPEMTFLMIDGTGDPAVSPEYSAAVQAVYSLSYGLKFAVRHAGGPDRKVSPLEGLWWWDGGSDFASAPRSEWSWTTMIRQPPEVTPELFAESRPRPHARSRGFRSIVSDTRRSTKGCAPRSCIAAPTPTSHRRSCGFTHSSPNRAANSSAGTTRSTCRIRLGPRRRRCAPCFASRCGATND